MTKFVLSLLLILAVVSPSAFSQGSKEKEIGEKTFTMIKTTMGIYEDDKLLEVIQKIGHTLESQMDLGYKLNYFLVDTYEPNAFATAGGYVYVTRGLLAIVNNRDELAGILAHELSHVTENHVTKKMKVSILPLVLQLPGKLVGALSSESIGSLINLPISATSKIGIAAYSRSQEKEADKLGLALATKAGYNPYGLIAGLERLTSFVEFITGKKSQKSILTDHPMTADRAAYLTKMIEESGHRKIEMEPGSDIIPVNGLIYGQNPNAGVVNESIFLHPTIKLYCKFPDDWEIKNYPELLTAISKDKKSTILLSLDGDSTNSPTESGKKLLTDFKTEDILHQETTTINGNEAFRATVRSAKGKFSGQVAEIMIIKMKTSDTMLRVVGAYESTNSDQAIITCFNSFRGMNDADFDKVLVNKIELMSTHSWTDIAAYAKASNHDEKYLELLCILNGVKPEQNIPSTHYLKVVTTSVYIPE